MCVLCPHVRMPTVYMHCCESPNRASAPLKLDFMQPSVSCHVDVGDPGALEEWPVLSTYPVLGNCILTKIESINKP